MHSLAALAKEYLGPFNAWLVLELGAFVAAWCVLVWVVRRDPNKLDGAYWLGLAPVQALTRLASRVRSSYALVAAVAATLVVAVSVVNMPVPRIHDEFANVLGAETFAQGRLANPMHEQWPFFETFHVLMQPTYASKYPPAHALFMALGELGGVPLAGTWLAWALAVVAVFWLARAALPPAWALAAAFITAWHGRMLLSWGTTYWAGAPSLLGGALVYGAVLRLADPSYWQRRGAWGPAWLLALGITLTIYARPYEGVVGILPGLLYLTWRLWLRRAARPWVELRPVRIAVTTALVAVGIPAVGFLLAMNQAITGDPFKLPHVVYSERYEVSKAFFFQDTRDGISFSRPEQQAFYSEKAEHHRYRASPEGFVKTQVYKLWYQYRFHLGVLLLVPFICGIRRRHWHQPPLALAAAGIGASLLATSLTTYEHPHYIATTSGLLMLVITQGVRDLWQSPWWSTHGRRLLILAATAAFMVEPLFVAGWQIARPKSAFSERRAAHARTLEARGGRHVIFVAYAPDHVPGDEWVYNGAAIDDAPVVWAHDLGERNAQLMDYYKRLGQERQFWRLDADRTPTELQPFSTH
jgi:hypothetical protein